MDSARRRPLATLALAASAVALLAAAPAGAQQCLSLAASNVCTGWTTSSVNVSASWSAGTFDNYMQNWADSASHIADFNDAYGCSWDGTGIRYALTYGCAERIFLSDKGCNAAGAPKAICKTTCSSYLTSVQTVLTSATICPAQGGTAGGKTVTATQVNLRQATINYVTSFCNTYAQDTGCATAVTMDNGNCGFFNRPNTATQFCASSGTSTCCASLDNKAFSYAAIASGGGSNSMLIYIALGVGIPVVLIAVGLILFFVLRRRRARKQEGFRVNKSGSKKDSGYDYDDQYASAYKPNGVNGNGVQMNGMNGGANSAFMNKVRSGGPDWEPVGWQTERGMAGGPPMTATAQAYARGLDWQEKKDYDRGYENDEAEHHEEYHQDDSQMIPNESYATYNDGRGGDPSPKRKSSRSRKSTDSRRGERDDRGDRERGDRDRERDDRDRGSKSRHSRKKSDGGRDRDGGRDAARKSSSKHKHRSSVVYDDQGGDYYDGNGGNGSYYSGQ